MSAGKIKIISDKHKVMKSGDEIEVMDFIRDYLNSIQDDEDLKDWLQNIPIPDSVQYIADEFGIVYTYA